MTVDTPNRERLMLAAVHGLRYLLKALEQHGIRHYMPTSTPNRILQVSIEPGVLFDGDSVRYDVLKDGMDHLALCMYREQWVAMSLPIDPGPYVEWQSVKDGPSHIGVRVVQERDTIDFQVVGTRA
jgi:hypothetical protein